MKALITGASGGIGSAVAELLRQNGYEILTLSSRFEDADALAKECRALAAAQGIDALILCAGTAKFAPLEAMSEGEILNLAKQNCAKWLEGKSIVKEIYVKNKLVNLVIK